MGGTPEEFLETFCGSYPSGKAMNALYDVLRKTDTAMLRAIYDIAVLRYCENWHIHYQLIAYQCMETARRWNSGQWEYHHRAD